MCGRDVHGERRDEGFGRKLCLVRYTLLIQIDFTSEEHSLVVVDARFDVVHTDPGATAAFESWVQ